ncbi:MAG: DUF6382 domain-containing protein [Clostridia bacterium]|nr:DUF6382 domain-containing protein [Clostridia bacterium]
MWENNEYAMCFREDAILDFERIMLSSGECSYLLPMLFVSGDAKHVAYYDCKGYVPLSRYRVDRTEDALFILERVLIILSSAIEYLITPAKISLSTDTVFFNVETGDIKIAYVPVQEVPAGASKNLLRFIAQLKADVTDGYKDYLDRFAAVVYANNYHLRELTDRMGLLRRELYLQTSASS